MASTLTPAQALTSTVTPTRESRHHTGGEEPDGAGEGRGLEGHGVSQPCPSPDGLLRALEDQVHLRDQAWGLGTGGLGLGLKAHGQGYKSGRSFTGSGPDSLRSADGRSRHPHALKRDTPSLTPNAAWYGQVELKRLLMAKDPTKTGFVTRDDMLAVSHRVGQGQE